MASQKQRAAARKNIKKAAGQPSVTNAKAVAEENAKSAGTTSGESEEVERLNQSERRLNDESRNSARLPVGNKFHMQQPEDYAIGVLIALRRPGHDNFS